MLVSIRGFVALIVLSLTVLGNAAQPLEEGLTPMLLESGDPFGEQGWDVDISGNLAIVGAPFYQGGSAFIYDLSTGSMLHRLTASDSSANALFGFSVAIDGDLAVVASGQRNAAYIFDTATGAQLHKLTPTARNSDFVRSVDISNGVAVVGTPTVEFGEFFTTDYGAAFLYNANTGTRISRINGPTSFNKRGFGGKVAIEGDTVAVRSPAFGGREDVYVLEAQTGGFRWSYGFSTTGERFYSKDIVIDGDHVVVGGGSASLFDMPSAFVFDRSAGDLLNEIDIHVVNDGDDYRSQIGVSGDRLVVGAWGTYYEETGYYTGSVHSFDLTTGDFLGTIPNPAPAILDNFGYAVALQGRRLVVGAPSDDGGRGLAYSYLLVPEPTTIALSLFAASCGLSRGWRRNRSIRAA